MEKSSTVWLHLSFWLFFSILPRLIAPPAFHIELYFVTTLLLDIFTFYLFYSWIIPDFFKAGIRSRMLLISLSLIFILIFIRIGFSNYFASYNQILNEQVTKSPILYILKESINTLLFVIYPLMLTFIKRYFIEQKIKLELINQNRESELSLLRSQINPHFFFNTLNNIYSLVYSGSKDAHKAVMMLSDLMRYNLYKANSDKVMLESELEYLMNYIDLELLRVKDATFLRKVIVGDPAGLKISPMLLSPFVENAFKHCDKNASSPGIELNLIINNNQLNFSIINKSIPSGLANPDEIGGIGLKNVKKRLDLLYSGKYHLEIKNMDDLYQVNLELHLNN